MVRVELTMLEFCAAVDVARVRIMTSAGLNLNHASTYKRGPMTRMAEEIIGACAEIAFAKALDRFYVPPLNNFHSTADILSDIEIRGTRREGGRLIVRDNDSPDRRYVLVVVNPPEALIVGWILGRDARRDEWLDNPNGYRRAWFVPQDALSSVSDEALGQWAEEAA